MADNRDQLVFVPLGGVGEIGMNMAAYGYGPERSRKWLVVDCGVTFARPQQPGIELIMADPTFLEDNADDVVALVLTHSHEDHYGAVLDLWPAFDRPVYATAFTAAMLAAKRAADEIVDNVAVRPMDVGKPFSVDAIDGESVTIRTARGGRVRISLFTFDSAVKYLEDRGHRGDAWLETKDEDFQMVLNMENDRVRAASYVLAILEAAGLVEIDHGRPNRVRLSA